MNIISFNLIGIKDMFTFIRYLFFIVCEKLKLNCKKIKLETHLNVASPPKKRQKKQILVYNSELIHSLEQDHQVLLSLYTDIMKYATNRQYHSLAQGLNDFSERLTTHLRKEGIDLYMYLEFVVAKRDAVDTRETLRDFRLEMKEISIAVSSVLHHYENMPVTHETVEKFLIDFKELGRILVDRIAREEKTLYPIYMNLKEETNRPQTEETPTSQLSV
jgi:hypothetical protein